MVIVHHQNYKQEREREGGDRPSLIKIGTVQYHIKHEHKRIFK